MPLVVGFEDFFPDGIPGLAETVTDKIFETQLLNDPILTETERIVLSVLVMAAQ